MKMIDLRFGVCIVMLMRIVNGFFVPITLVEDAVAKGAVCLDGSPPGYHYDKGFGTGVNNWLIHMEGGAWCNTATTCFERTKDRLGSSKLMTTNYTFSGILANSAKYNPANPPHSGRLGSSKLMATNYNFAGIFANSAKYNPGSSKLMTTNYTFAGIFANRAKCSPDFHNWNRVKIRYCDGSSYTGDVEAVDAKNPVYYRGARLWRAIMDDLLAKGMKDAQSAILGGCSAGGLGAILQCDNFRSLLSPEAKVKCLSDAGFFINSKDLTGKPHIEELVAQAVATHGSAKNLPAECTSQFSPELCFFPQYAARFVKTPLFLLNSAYDSWQIKNTLAPGVADPHGQWKACKSDILKCNDSQIETMHGFRKEFLAAFESLGDLPTRGYYLNSCYSHCQSGAQETWLRDDSPLLNNTSISKAVGDWFFDRNIFRAIDCPYPCDKTCHNRVFE